MKDMFVRFCFYLMKKRSKPTSGLFIFTAFVSTVLMSYNYATSCNLVDFDLESELPSIIMMKMWRRLLYLTTLVLTESSFMFLLKQRLKKMSSEITT